MGFRYREVAHRLRFFGFQFDRKGAGSHEVWRHAETGRKITIPTSFWRYGGRNAPCDFARSGNRCEQVLERWVGFTSKAARPPSETGMPKPN
ncbi:MAG TPA: type II toxin-antitoxin system HicA family toxin [Verrucomicrobiae bacterium]|nr:type II toxin-antitoxin system HicA family toxin [Verrucomicrobiae bacterium]